MISNDMFTDPLSFVAVDVLECPSCGHKSDTNASFQDIPLNLPETSGDSKEGLVFADLLAAATAPETLDAQNLWTCGGCSAPVAAKKTVTYNTLPPVLFTHLKRTGYDQVGATAITSFSLCDSASTFNF
jgi:ubiquitin C-terminal hydrolase